jgi:hypothetical protein
MSVLDTQPASFNPLNPANFKVIVKKCPNINWSIQRALLPGISSPQIPVGNPFTNIHHAGDHIQFQPLSLRFRISESLEEYLEMFRWMQALGFPESWEQYRDLAEANEWQTHGLRSDISVIIQNNILVPAFEIVYVGAFPVSLSGFELSTVEPNVLQTTAEVTFSYTYFHLDALPGAECAV